MQWLRMMMFGAVLAFTATACTSDDVQQPGEQPAESDEQIAPAAETPTEAESQPVPGINAVRIEPEEPATGDMLEAVVEAEGGNLLFEYVWFADGGRIAGENRSTLDGSRVQRDSSIHVEVTPIYEGEPGTAVAASAVSVVNSPPEVTDVRTVSLEDDKLVLQVEAHDPDGDTLRYELKSSPDGMQIDSTGRITWTIPEGGESADYSVIVSDGEYEFQFDQTLGFETQRVD